MKFVLDDVDYETMEKPKYTIPIITLVLGVFFALLVFYMYSIGHSYDEEIFMYILSFLVIIWSLTALFDIFVDRKIIEAINISKEYKDKFYEFQDLCHDEVEKGYKNNINYYIFAITFWTLITIFLCSVISILMLSINIVFMITTIIKLHKHKKKKGKYVLRV